jgi:predicted O-methyltransferase YrrM
MDLFFKLERHNDNYNIIDDNIVHKYLDTQTVNEYNNIHISLKENTNKDIKYVYDRFNKIKIKNQYYLWFLLDFDINNSYNILSNEFDSDFYITKIIENGNNIEYIGDIYEVNDKYKNILYNMQSEKLIKKIKEYDLCKREELLYNNKLQTILYLFDFLEKGGNFFISIHGFCNDKIIEIYYILSFMFEYCMIYNTTYILCKNFNSILKKSDFVNIINKPFSIEPKYDIDKLINYMNDNLKYHVNKYNLLLQKKEDDFLDFIKSEILNSVKYYDHNKLNELLVEYNFSIIENFKRTFIDNKLVKTSSAINSVEGRKIIEIINEYKFTKCLEIGMAYGVSAFYILSNLNTKLISIDPNQDTQWNNYGVKLLNEFNFNTRHKLYKLKSYVALPKLLKKKGNNYFDFIFIDGFHTFDYTLIDFFYSNLLLKINGIIIIDDAMHSGVKKCVDYIISNYKFYKKLESSSSIAVFIKLKEDMRDWKFHYNF